MFSKNRTRYNPFAKQTPSTVRSMSYHSCSVPSTADKIIASSRRPSLALMQDNNDKAGLYFLANRYGQSLWRWGCWIIYIENMKPFADSNLSDLKVITSRYQRSQPFFRVARRTQRAKSLRKEVVDSNLVER